MAENDRLLTDEEIQKAIDDTKAINMPPPIRRWLGYRSVDIEATRWAQLRAISKAQAKLTREETAREIFEEMEMIISQEPESLGDMPNDIWQQLQDREDATIVLRAIVSATKKNIMSRCQALKTKYGGER